MVISFEDSDNFEKNLFQMKGQAAVGNYLVTSHIPTKFKKRSFLMASVANDVDSGSFELGHELSRFERLRT